MDISAERRAALAKKIKALLLKTTEAGCTEEEALAAALAAAQLQAEYQINLTEAEFLAEGFDTRVMPWINQKMQFIQERLITPVARFTNTRGYARLPERNQSKKDGLTLEFCGFKTDVIFAEWLLVALASYVHRAAMWHITFESVEGSQKEGYRSFVLGTISRIAQRLRNLQQETPIQTDTGMALVVLDKINLISNYLAEQGLTLIPKKVFDDSIGDSQAFQAGLNAGNNVGFNRPINGDGKVKQIT